MPIVPNPLGWPALIIVVVVIIVGTAYIMWDESQDAAEADGEHNDPD